MNQPEIIEFKLLPALRECALHQARMHSVWAEKLGVLPSVEQWQWLRELRNQTAREYPDNPALMMENLRRLVAHVPMLEGLYQHLVGAADVRLAAISP